MRVQTLILIAVAILVGGVIIGSVSHLAWERRDKPCVGHIHMLEMMMQMYVVDNCDTFPDSDRWVDALSEYTTDPTILKCPRETSSARSSYAMNEQLSGLHLSQLRDPQNTVVLYETKHPGESPSGGPGDVVSPPRHAGRNAYAFVYLSGWSEEIPRFEPYGVWHIVPSSTAARLARGAGG